jgi:hypothetical protein
MFRFFTYVRSAETNIQPMYTRLYTYDIYMKLPNHPSCRTTAAHHACVVFKLVGGVRICWDPIIAPSDDGIATPAGILLIKGVTRAGRLRHRRWYRGRSRSASPSTKITRTRQHGPYGPLQSCTYMSDILILQPYPRLRRGIERSSPSLFFSLPEFCQGWSTWAEVLA